MSDHRDGYKQRLKNALSDLKGAKRSLRRLLDREEAGITEHLKNRAESIEAACRSSYISIREIEWNDGIPSEEGARRASDRFKARSEGKE